jgi:AraC-like DNA-binding protein
MGGLEVLARMKEADPQVAVILVTAVNEVGTAVKGMKLGALDYITKPWNESALLASVRGAASRQGAPRGVLLIGDDMGPLAALQLALEQNVRVTTLPPAAVGLPGLERAPALVIFDSMLAPEAAAGFVRALRERFARVPLMVMTRDIHMAMRVPELAALAPARLIEKPYRLNEVLSRIAALLSPRVRLNGSWRYLGPHVHRAIDHMAAHYQEPLSVSDMAQAVGLSVDRLTHVFRDGLGVAVKDYLERLRVTVGRRLLAETDLKMDEVGQRCGFADASHFSRVFMDHTGTRPGEYRRRSAVLRGA